MISSYVALLVSSELFLLEIAGLRWDASTPIMQEKHYMILCVCVRVRVGVCESVGVCLYVSVCVYVYLCSVCSCEN